jgi:hypothetical protein
LKYKKFVVLPRILICKFLDPLSPLWPILGTIASFVITAVCILSGMIVEKIRGEPKNTLSEEEIDG